MTTIGIESSALSLLTGLAEPALRALALAVVAGLALMVLRVSRTSVRLCVWTIVLGAALAMPALDLVMPPLPLRVMPVAIVDSHTAPPPTTAVELSRMLSALAIPNAGPDTRTIPVDGAQTAAPAPTSQAVAAPARQAPAGLPVPWSLALLLVYGLGVLALLGRAIIGWFATRRFARGTLSIDDATALARLRVFTTAAGLAHAPRLAESDACRVPITMGIVSPVIVLPASWREWRAATLDAVLIHELAHVGRRDALTQALSLLHRAIFWFNPLSWWLRRRLELLAEDASDEAVLAGGIERTTYAEALLDFFTALGPDRRRAVWQVAMAQGAGPERRIARILAWTGGHSRGLTRTVAVAVALAAMVAIGVVAAIQPARAMVEMPPPPVEIEIRAVPADHHGPSVSSAPVPTAPGRTTSHAGSAPAGGRQAAPQTPPQASWRTERAAMFTQLVEWAQRIQGDIRAMIQIGTMAPLDAASHDRTLAELKRAAEADARSSSESSKPSDGEIAAVRNRFAGAVRALNAEQARFNVGLSTVKNVDEALMAGLAALQQAPAGDQHTLSERSAEMTFAPGLARPDDSGVTAPKLLEAPKPFYTPEAIREKVQGVVELECVVKVDGTVGEWRIVQSLDTDYGLDNQAVIALQGYRFTPGTLNGQPVPVVVRVVMTFTLR